LNDVIQLTIRYNLDTLEVVFIAENITEGEKITESMTLSRAVTTLRHAQIDITGAKAASRGTGDTRPGFDAFAVYGR
jgi:poly-beta-hydroxyalkanoate depolymerase